MKGASIEAALILVLVLSPQEAPGVSMFVRGDVDSGGMPEISDAVLVLGYLFLADPLELDCEDAADANDDGSVDIADPIYLLIYLFGEGKEPPAPFPDCGFDPTDDFIFCRTFKDCPHDVCGGIIGRPCPDESYFCEFPTGQCCCDQQGVCLPRPTACPKNYDPVCGCDGVTYSNDCLRRAAGMSKDHDGPCKGLTERN